MTGLVGSQTPGVFGLRYVQQVWAGGRNCTASAADAASISHESDGLAVDGAVQGQLRLGGKAGDHLIGGDGESSQLPAVGGDVVEKDGGGDTEAGVRIGVVPDVVGIEQVGVLAVIARDTAGDSDGSGAAGGVGEH